MNTLSNSINKTVLTAMSRRAFDEQPLNIEELPGSSSNSVFRVTLPGRTVILKVALQEDTQVVSGGRNAMAEEAAVIEKISQFRFMPVPHILFYDRSRRVAGSEYLFMENLPGVPFSNVHDSLSDEKRSELYTQAGIYTRKLNAVSSDFYGSLSDKKRRYIYWSRCFYCLVDDLLRQAEELRLELPLPPDRIRRRIKNEAPLLNNVKKPMLIHGDLHLGNFLVDSNSTEITGMIRFDRAFYGYPLLDLPRAALDDNDSFVCSFLSGSTFCPEQLLRIAIYRICVGLYMLRHMSTGTDGMEEPARACLARGLREYKDFRGEPF